MHIYSNPRTYTVKSTVPNAYGSDSKTPVNYIEVNVALPDIIVTTWPYPIYSFDSLDTEFGINSTAGGLLVYIYDTMGTKGGLMIDQSLWLEWFTSDTIRISNSRKIDYVQFARNPSAGGQMAIDNIKFCLEPPP